MTTDVSLNVATFTVTGRRTGPIKEGRWEGENPKELLSCCGRLAQLATNSYFQVVVESMLKLFRVPCWDRSHIDGWC